MAEFWEGLKLKAAKLLPASTAKPALHEAPEEIHSDFPIYNRTDANAPVTDASAEIIRRRADAAHSLHQFARH